MQVVKQTDNNSDTQKKLEWQEPSFEHLNDPESGFGGVTESVGRGPS